ncbi:hypothetical protein H312_01120 [Anncaliia algerae PRA339]|uniref:5'-3' DNA helicase ZGRF1-like N-terminal domain-containing protein n=1 Tax=Anncaliia algerae PRA339 TaxID=1288291 RepID=A0A059F2E4_9MICR|nr:hypothetical protein H312_01120 [Anncaliia algerae PRA339]
MQNCIYTKDIIKKSKTWLEGFIEKKENKVILYDEEKKIISSKLLKEISQELRIGIYLVYVDNIETMCNDESIKDQSIKRTKIERNEVQKVENNINKMNQNDLIFGNRTEEEILKIIDDLTENK